MEDRNSKFMAEFGRHTNDGLGDFASVTTLEKCDFVMWLGLNWLRVGSNDGTWQFLSD
jgi:hypothetical protein